MSKFKNWKDVKKELNFTPEEEAEMKLEMELMGYTLKVVPLKEKKKAD